MRPDAYTETADSIVEHARAIARLDARALGADAYADTVARHVHAMRVLAAAHVDPALDRAFFKALQAAAAGAAGVQVRFVDGIAHVIVDAAAGGVRTRPHRFDLLSPAQVERRGDDDAY